MVANTIQLFELGDGEKNLTAIQQIATATMLPSPSHFIPIKLKSQTRSFRCICVKTIDRFLKCWQRLAPILRPATCISIIIQEETSLIENGNIYSYISERNNNFSSLHNMLQP